MDELLKRKIYDEMFMYMTAKNNKNEYIHLDLTRREMKQILLSTFHFNLQDYKKYIHNVWKTIQTEMLNEINLSTQLENLTLNPDVHQELDLKGLNIHSQ